MMILQTRPYFFLLFVDCVLEIKHLIYVLLGLAHLLAKKTTRKILTEKGDGSEPEDMADHASMRVGLNGG